MGREKNRWDPGVATPVAPIESAPWGPVMQETFCTCSVETLPHVVNHCMRYSSLYKERHNAVVETVKRAAAGRWTVVSENQVIDGSWPTP